MNYKIIIKNIKFLVKDVENGKMDKNTAAAMITKYKASVDDLDDRTKVEYYASLAAAKLSQV